MNFKLSQLWLWMYHRPKLGWLLAIPWLFIPVMWTFDREPPFKVIKTYQSKANPGGFAFIVADVKRDTKRNCSATYTRYIYTPGGYRLDLEGVQYASAAHIEEINTKSPDKLQVLLPIPKTITAGQASLITLLKYECNPIHKLWPIEVKTEFAFEVIE
jgi:hypothetical protein